MSGSSRRSRGETFTVNITPQIPAVDDADTVRPNKTFTNISASDLLSKVTDVFESYNDMDALLDDDEIWRYFHGGNPNKELKTRRTFRNNGIVPNEESGRYVDIIAIPGYERGEFDSD
ncbi:uncharacterized protein DFL_000117 [Arthrobotrys flagrans]|uniref:Uncharacterized protein n=1 Tax=Arthrobotrys flagrans TaxID=97331 RepID=A0A437AD78_ARTFL|nr:hypothetical protein DFL_000117 [Arthrobotrys flagrans]